MDGSIVQLWSTVTQILLSQQNANHKGADCCRYGGYGCLVNPVHSPLGIRGLLETPSHDQCWYRGLLVASDDQPI